MSKKEQVIEICRPTNQLEAEVVRLLLGTRGIHCVFKDDSGVTISVMESKADKARKLINKAGKHLCKGVKPM